MILNPLMMVMKEMHQSIYIQHIYTVMYISYLSVKHIQVTGFPGLFGEKKSRPILVTGKRFQTLNLINKFHFHLWEIKIQYLDLFMIFYVNSRPSCAKSKPFQALSDEKKCPTISRSGISKMKFQTFFQTLFQILFQILGTLK